MRFLVADVVGKGLPMPEWSNVLRLGCLLSFAETLLIAPGPAISVSITSMIKIISVLHIEVFDAWGKYMKCFNNCVSFLIRITIFGTLQLFGKCTHTCLAT